MVRAPSRRHLTYREQASDEGRRGRRAGPADGRRGGPPRHRPSFRDPRLPRDDWSWHLRSSRASTMAQGDRPGRGGARASLGTRPELADRLRRRRGGSRACGRGGRASVLRTEVPRRSMPRLLGSHPTDQAGLAGPGVADQRRGLPESGSPYSLRAKRLETRPARQRPGRWSASGLGLDTGARERPDYPHVEGDHDDCPDGVEGDEEEVRQRAEAGQRDCSHYCPGLAAKQGEAGADQQ